MHPSPGEAAELRCKIRYEISTNRTCGILDIHKKTDEGDVDRDERSKERLSDQILS